MVTIAEPGLRRLAVTASQTHPKSDAKHQTMLNKVRIDRRLAQQKRLSHQPFVLLSLGLVGVYRSVHTKWLK
jgi:hypothetical protein